MKKKSTLLFFLLLTANLCLRAQVSETMFRALLITKLSENVNWSNEAKFTKFVIGLPATDTALINVFKKNTSLNIKKKAIDVKVYNSADKLSGANIVFVDIENQDKIEKIFAWTKANNALLITDQYKDQVIVMINLLKFVANSKVKFEVNKANIIFAGLDVSPNLLLIGGSEIDIRELYKKSEASSKELRVKLDKQEKELAEKQAELEKKKSEIVKQQQEIAKQKEEITKQNNLISVQKQELGKLLEDIKTKEAVLAGKLKQIKDQEDEIAQKSKAIQRQKEEEKMQSETLKKQIADIENQEKKIKEQKNVLGDQQSQIARQQKVLITFVILFILILILLIYVVRSYLQKQKLNKKLESQQEVISQKNGLLEAQAEELTVSNELLTKEREETMASIHYAKTIQQAILPIPALMAAHFNTFAIFRPRDIVSGDLYGFHHFPAKDGKPEKWFFATIDCTGHGVPGAFMTMIANRLLNSIVGEKGIVQPELILDMMDKEINIALHQDVTLNRDGMDMCMCMIEKDSSKQKDFQVIFAGAKRPLFVIEEGKLSIIAGSHKSIGGNIRMQRQKNYEQTTLFLNKNALLYLTTDGIVDQCNEQRKNFGIERLTKLLLEISPLSFDKQQAKLEESFDKYVNKTPQRDDITLFAIKL